MLWRKRRSHDSDNRPITHFLSPICASFGEEKDSGQKRNDGFPSLACLCPSPWYTMVFTKVTTRWQGRLVEQHHKRFSHRVVPLSCTLDSPPGFFVGPEADGIQDPVGSHPFAYVSPDKHHPWCLRSHPWCVSSIALTDASMNLKIARNCYRTIVTTSSLLQFNATNKRWKQSEIPCWTITHCNVNYCLMIFAMLNIINDDNHFFRL